MIRSAPADLVNGDLQNTSFHLLFFARSALLPWLLCQRVLRHLLDLQHHMTGECHTGELHHQSAAKPMDLESRRPAFIFLNGESIYFERNAKNYTGWPNK